MSPTIGCLFKDDKGDALAFLMLLDLFLFDFGDLGDFGDLFGDLLVSDGLLKDSFIRSKLS